MKTREEMEALVNAYGDAMFEYGEAQFGNGDDEYDECVRTIGAVRAALDQVYDALAEAPESLPAADSLRRITPA